MAINRAYLIDDKEIYIILKIQGRKNKNISKIYEAHFRTTQNSFSESPFYIILSFSIKQNPHIQSLNDIQLAIMLHLIHPIDFLYRSLQPGGIAVSREGDDSFRRLTKLRIDIFTRMKIGWLAFVPRSRICCNTSGKLVN